MPPYEWLPAASSNLLRYANSTYSLPPSWQQHNHLISTKMIVFSPYKLRVHNGDVIEPSESLLIAIA